MEIIYNIAISINNIIKCIMFLLKTVLSWLLISVSFSTGHSMIKSNNHRNLATTRCYWTGCEWGECLDGYDVVEQEWCWISYNEKCCQTIPDPTINPTRNPTLNPTRNPTINHTINPTRNPTLNPTINPTLNPTRNPTLNPTRNPTIVNIVNKTNVVNQRKDRNSDIQINNNKGTTLIIILACTILFILCIMLLSISYVKKKPKKTIDILNVNAIKLDKIINTIGNTTFEGEKSETLSLSTTDDEISLSHQIEGLVYSTIVN